MLVVRCRWTRTKKQGKTTQDVYEYVPTSPCCRPTSMYFHYLFLVKQPPPSEFREGGGCTTSPSPPPAAGLVIPHTGGIWWVFRKISATPESRGSIWLPVEKMYLFLDGSIQWGYHLCGCVQSTALCHVRFITRGRRKARISFNKSANRETCAAIYVLNRKTSFHDLG